MGELGLTAAPLPESVGGAGFSYLGWTLVMEELGAADMSMAVSLSVHILSQYPVVTWGTPEQHARWLPPMLTGEALGAFALTEPHAGQRRGGDPDPGRARRAGRRADRLSPDRDQDLDLERPRGRPLPRLRHARSGGRREGRSPRSWSRRGRPASGSGRTSGRWGSGPARPRSSCSMAPRSRSRTGSARRARATRSRCRRSGEGRISIAAACVGIARAGLEAVGRVPRATEGVRGAARRAAGPAVHARRDGPRGRRGAGA